MGMISVDISWDNIKNLEKGLSPVPEQPEIAEWLEKNCKNTYEYPVKIYHETRNIMPVWFRVHFSDINDAMHFKLTWG